MTYKREIGTAQQSLLKELTTEKISLVEPLARISEPVFFAADSPDAGLQADADRKTHLGAKALKAAAQTSGPYFVVED